MIFNVGDVRYSDLIRLNRVKFSVQEVSCKNVFFAATRPRLVINNLSLKPRKTNQAVYSVIFTLFTRIFEVYVDLPIAIYSFGH